jgi:pyrimidine operon attenuation protein / uracil phosphoribosyltransferase
MPASASRPLMDPAALAEGIRRLAADLLADPRGARLPLVLVGIHKRGVPLAERLSRALLDLSGSPVPVGTLDITQYRDDLGSLRDLPTLVGSDIPFDIDGARVVLCDEVIYTGRSIRAALAELLDFGRPALVQLAVLVDRGGREFPIQPDFTALTVQIQDRERVAVQFTEVDPADGVFIESPPAP